MKVSNKKLILTAGLAVIGIGGWSVYNSTNEPENAVIDVIDATALSAEIEVIDESNRPEAIVEVYRNLLEREYLDAKDELKRVDIDETLVQDTKILNYPFPMALKNEKEPEMTMLLQKLLSRHDGTTNEVKDVNYRAVNEETFHKWEELFAQWTDGEIEKTELVKEWNGILKTVPDSLLVEPTVLTFEFPHSDSAIEMMDSVLERIEKDGGSTAPHISFVYVEFNEEEALYTLYYAGSHIE